MMELCPFCGSENIYYSRKRKIFVCEECDETFSDTGAAGSGQESEAKGGLELFFSYGHDRNRLLVERIRRDLEKRGHHVWIDTSEIKAGDHWRDDILNGVLHASSVIAFLSEHSTRIPGVCLDELKIAVCVKGARIKTVLLEPEEKITPPSTLSEIQWLDMSRWYEIKTSSEEDFEAWYRGKFAELCRAIESAESMELSGDIHVLKTRLMPYLNSDKEYTLLAKDFYGRKWLEDYLNDWKQKRTTRSLMIYGKPGSGKSAFSVNYAHYNSSVLGCFLCEWNKEYTINVSRLIRTMAFRLAAKLPDYRTLLLRQLEEDVILESMNMESLFDFLLAYPLSHLVDGNREPGIIVVDGLDEAETNGENPLAELFAKCADRMPGWIRFVFTSRPERNVSKYFVGCEHVDIVEDMPKGHNDIMAYLLKALGAELRMASNKLELLGRICALCDGVFLYAELLVADIQNGVISLNEIDAFPRGLNGFYRMSIERKFHNQTVYEEFRPLLETLCVSDAIPEELVRGVNGYSRYNLITRLDRLGSWISQYEENGQRWLGFSHKSIRDWFTNAEQSNEFFVDSGAGAARLARWCRQYIRNGPGTGDEITGTGELKEYIRQHIGSYFVAAACFDELQEFLLQHTEDPDPFWRIWNRFPSGWDHSAMLEAFWKSPQRNGFVERLQKEGNAAFLKWMFDMASDQIGISGFDRKTIQVYMDIVHISGDYAGAVAIADRFIGENQDRIGQDEFLTMLSIRRLHHRMFYMPAGQLIEEALDLLEKTDDRFPVPYNELLFLIGGNLGVLHGDWDFCREWLAKSSEFTEKHNLGNFRKRNARKLADCWTHEEQYGRAEQILKAYIRPDGKITDRYEAYLVGALANVYTCTGREDDALECYEQLRRYTMANGIAGWTAHANLGTANVNLKLGNLKEAADFGNRAMETYRRIHQEWGIIMSGAVLSACESEIGVAPMEVACGESISRAGRMEYGSCAESIREMCEENGKYYMKLFFL